MTLLAGERERLEDARRRRLIDEARAAGLTEIRADELTARRFGVVEHPDGRRYKVVAGVVTDPRFSPAIAFYLAETGAVVWLEALP